MKYSLKYIMEKRYDPKRSDHRRLTERFIPLNIMVKLLSPYPTYLFLNFGLHADVITFISFAFIIISGLALVWGYATIGICSLLLFALLDSVDGDMARILARQSCPTAYGGILDSFGADFFYGFMPIALGYHMFSLDIKIISLGPHYLFLFSGLVSISFLLYRIMNVKLINFSNYQKYHTGDIRQVGEIVKEEFSSGFLAKIIALYRHPVLRGNFFSEAGMIFWFLILIAFKLYILLAWYLIVILLYNVGYLFLNFISAYIYFVKSGRG